MFRRKNPQDLGWMCAVRESEESDKSLVSGLDNLVDDGISYYDSKHKRRNKS